MQSQDLDRCLNLWIHQNSLLWGRLQTIAAIQGAVLGGWYFLFTGEQFIWAFLLAALGTFLSERVHALIKCDLALRKIYKDKIENEIAPGFLPQHTGVPGYKIITTISFVFVAINVVITVLSLLCSWYFFDCPFAKCS